MVTYVDSVKTGNWGTGSTWSTGQEPQTGQHARVNSTHTVTYESGTHASPSGLYMNGGALVINADMNISDESSSLIYISAAPENSITTNATAASPRKIYNVNGNARSNPTPIQIADIVGTDARTLSLDYCYFEGFKYFIGDDTNYIYFNGLGSTDPLALNISPLTRDVFLEEHDILGRTKGRSYPKYISCGTITISGKCHITNFLEEQILAIINAGKSVAFAGGYSYMKKGRIERYRVGEAKGGLWKPFSITIREEE